MSRPLPESPCLCIRIRRAAQRVTDFYDARLAPVGVSVNQYSLLANINRMGECGTGELARRVGLEKSTLVRTLMPLCEAGYVADLSPEGSRKRRLCLTALGREVLERAVPLWEKAQEELRAELGAGYAGLVEFLRHARTL